MTPVLVLTTVGATFDPAPLATHLVEKRLAACVNVIPQIYSVYRWKGAIEKDAEQLLLIKTIDTQVDALRDALFAMHPYAVPEFVVVTIDNLSDAYRSWLAGELQPAE
ncbi:MAG: divalent-cation tolerance protein CutA [Acidobacteriota bacterium]|nr:divalent-cation tolerance protein CutA [Acidobacteriota bacterium]